MYRILSQANRIGACVREVEAQSWDKPVGAKVALVTMSADG
jgi:hypothetical protein